MTLRIMHIKQPYALQHTPSKQPYVLKHTPSGQLYVLQHIQIKQPIQMHLVRTKRPWETPVAIQDHHQFQRLSKVFNEFPQTVLNLEYLSFDLDVLVGLLKQTELLKLLFLSSVDVYDTSVNTPLPPLFLLETFTTQKHSLWPATKVERWLNIATITGSLHHIRRS